MITAEFYCKQQCFTGFSIRGHAGFSEYGTDVICAAVTSAVELTANGITEILKLPASVDSLENEVRLSLPEEEALAAAAFLQALRLHLELLQQDYSEYLRIIDLEV